MNDKDGGGQVYPSIYIEEKRVGEYVVQGPAERAGLSRRDWLAGLAMQGIMANGNFDDHETWMESVADNAYILADAMIAEGKLCR